MGKKGVGSWELGVGGRRELGVREIKGKAAIALGTLRTQHFLSYSALSTLHSALSLGNCQVV
uniref:Uncharacterized protein n=1 Tax=Desertifilum tharense IPPAS B-1220 TaxID=1781255 RepID=A0ACD5GQR6_9CYAN